MSVVIACLFIVILAGLLIAERARKREPDADLLRRNRELADRMDAQIKDHALEIQRLKDEHDHEIDFIGHEADRLLTAERHKLELEWAEKKRADRQLSNQRSRGALVAKIAEHMAPYLPGFKYNPKDARHVGELIDFIIYDGLEAGGPITIVFLEVKTSTTGRQRRVTNPREIMLRDAIENGRVKYQVFVPEAVVDAQTSLPSG